MFATTEGGPPNVGQTIIAMDPAFFSDGFVAHLEAMFTDLTHDNEVRVPGERRAALRRLHEAQGVEVPDNLLAQIAELSS